jgi:mannose-6-phosphate isomerase
MKIPPLRFKPIPVEKVWGGRKLERFGRELPQGERIGESWEISDYAGRRTEVAEGPLKGHTLPDLLKEFGACLTGPNGLDPVGRFPLLLKMIDASEMLSLQVHPDDATAAALQDPNGGKEEAWYVLDAEEDARMALGVKAGISKDELLAALKSGRADEVVNWYRIRRGDFIHVPPGMVHTIGQGITLMEIQQTSDATYRLCDWGRAQGRPLHLDEGMTAARLELRPRILHLEASASDRALCSTARLGIRHIQLTDRRTVRTGQAVVLFCLSGDCSVTTSAGGCGITAHQHLLLPADPGTALLEGEARLLYMVSRNK